MADVLGLLLVMLIVSRKGLPVNISSPLLVIAQRCVCTFFQKRGTCECMFGEVFLLLLGLVLAPLGMFLSKKNVCQSGSQSRDVSVRTCISQPLVFASHRSLRAFPKLSLGCKSLPAPPPSAACPSV